jgi:hypothetical protein
VSQDDVFEEDADPLDNPAASTSEAKITMQAADFVGCPMAWLKQVLPYIRGEGQLVVLLLLHRAWVLRGRRRTFDFPNGDLKKLGIHRSVKHKALARLETAGLISVEHRAGHATRITRHWR